MTGDYRIKRASLTEQVADLLERYIEENDLRPGDELPTEMDLSRLFGVSRTVIREGLSAAGALGLIEAETGRRSRVSGLRGNALDGFFSSALRLRSGAVIELLEVRAALELYGIRLTVEAPEEADLERLEEDLATMDEALREGDPERFVTADVEFHTTLVEMSGNEILLHLIRALRNATRQSIERGLQARTSLPDLEEIQQVHAEIVQAVKRSDAGAASAAVAKHFELAIAAVRDGEVAPTR